MFVRKVAIINIVLLFLFFSPLAVSQDNDSTWEVNEIDTFTATISYSHPALIDYDPSGSDGDLDVISGKNSGTLVYQENLSGNSSFILDIAESGVFTTLFSRSAPTIMDFNDDDLDDIIVGQSDGTLDFLIQQENGTFSSQNPNYHNDINVGSYSKPTLTDLNNDGQLDLVIGTGSENLNAYLNTGNETHPIWVENDQIFSGYLVGNHAAPFAFYPDDESEFADIIIGSQDNGITYLKHRGSFSNGLPEYHSISFRNQENPFNQIDFVSFRYLTPILYDIDGDSYLDLITGSENGDLIYYHNPSINFSDIQVPASSDQPQNNLLLIIAIIIIVLLIISAIILFIFSKADNQTGEPVYLMVLRSIGIAPYKFKFKEEIVSDLNLAGGAFSGIQSMISEVTNSDLNSLEAGDYKILIVREPFDDLDGFLQVLLWVDSENEILLKKCKHLAKYVVGELESYFKTGKFNEEFDYILENKVKELFSEYL